MVALVKTIGLVLFRRTHQGRRYLLLHHRGPYWNFPKGRAERHEGNDELATAFRELREETGLPRSAVRLVGGFRATYRYHFRGVGATGRPELVTKLAIFYLGELIADHAVKVSREHLGADWCDPPTAWRRLYYENGRKIFTAAEHFLDSRKPAGMVKAGR